MPRAQSGQQLKWPQGKNTIPTSASMQILHVRSSCIRSSFSSRDSSVSDDLDTGALRVLRRLSLRGTGVVGDVTALKQFLSRRPSSSRGLGSLSGMSRWGRGGRSSPSCGVGCAQDPKVGTPVCCLSSRAETSSGNVLKLDPVDSSLAATASCMSCWVKPISPNFSMSSSMVVLPLGEQDRGSCFVSFGVLELDPPVSRV